MVGKLLFDTILVRQVLHYVNSVDEILKLLKSVLKSDGLVYVGQIVTPDEDCKKWHDELMRSISKSRRRSFTQDELIECIKKNGFKIAQMEISDFEDKISDLYQRRINAEVPTSLEELKSRMEKLNTDVIKEQMSLRYENNDLHFKLRFCHLLCEMV